jgi:hypothetical protein
MGNLPRRFPGDRFALKPSEGTKKKLRRRAVGAARPNVHPHFFGYPIGCPSVIFCSGRSFIAFARAGLSMDARTTVANPLDAQ